MRIKVWIGTVAASCRSAASASPVTSPLATQASRSSSTICCSHGGHIRREWDPAARRACCGSGRWSDLAAMPRGVPKLPRMQSRNPGTQPTDSPAAIHAGQSQRPEHEQRTNFNLLLLARTAADAVYSQCNGSVRSAYRYVASLNLESTGDGRTRG
eukprot:SAG31_NODE_1924_length_6902_cov_5.916066_1_plen_156_part_00